MAEKHSGFEGTGNIDLATNSKDISCANITVTTAILLSSLTTGSVIFTGASGALSQDNAKLFWDNTNKRLGIGTATPSEELDVVGDIKLSGELECGGGRIISSDLLLQAEGDNNMILRLVKGEGAGVTRGAGFYLSNDKANPSTSANSDFGMLTLDNKSQMLMFVADSVVNSLTLTNIANRTKNHDHGMQTNPTFFVHSDTNPDTANTQWIGLTHDKTNGLITTGLGKLTLSPAGNQIQANGAIASGILTVNSANDATVAVGGVNNIFIDAPDTAPVQIDDFTGGVAGQVLHIVVRDNTDAVTFNDRSGANQQMYLHDQANLVLLAGERGGMTLICDGTHWYDVSHAKHV